MSAGCRMRALAKPGAAPTHKVTALRTFAFPGPSIKLPPVETLPMGARLDGGARGRRLRRDARRLVSAAPASRPPRRVRRSDFVAVAERFVGTPYLWGGKTSLGIDCSGLVQVALNAAGTGCPRDSDMQQDGLGRALTPAEIEEAAARRSDLLERPCRDRARRRHHRSRQRASHGDRDRKHARGDRAHQGRRQRGHRDQAADRPLA